MGVDSVPEVAMESEDRGHEVQPLDKKVVEGDEPVWNRHGGREKFSDRVAKVNEDPPSSVSQVDLCDPHPPGRPFGTGVP